MIDEKEVPNNWTIKTIGDVVNNAKNGGTPKKSKSNYWGGEVEWLSSGEIFGREVYTAEKSITEEGLNNSSAKIFPKDSVLVAMYGKTRGQSTILRNQMSGNQAICCLEPDENEVTPEYLLYFIKSIKQRLKDEGRGGGQKNINQSIILRQELPVPPLYEQAQIVDTVENRISRIKRLERSVENIIRLSEVYRNNLLAYIFTGKSLEQNSTIRGFPTEEELNETWEMRRLDEIATINPSVSFNQKDDYAYVPMDAVSEEGGIKRYDRRESLYSGLSKFREGDIVLARITPCFENGKIAKIKNIPDGYSGAVGSTELVVIRPKKIDQDFLYQYLRSPLVKQWGKNRLLGSTGRERIKISQFRTDLKVPVPPLDEQKHIVNKIDQIDFSKIANSSKILERLFNEYKRSVLSSAFHSGYIADTESINNLGDSEQSKQTEAGVHE